MRRAWAVVKRDLEDALKNSTFLLILLGPVICSVLFFRLSSDDNFGKPTLGLVGSQQEGLGLVLATSDSVVLKAIGDKAVAEVLLKEGEVDGYLVLEQQLSAEIADDAFPSLELRVVETESLRSRLLEKAIENGARTIAGQELPIDLVVQGDIGKSGDPSWAEGLLPNWLVFTAMSGLMFCSASIIEEKDHRTLLGVLTAPVSMVELWVGKVGSGFILAYLSTLAVLLGNGIIPSVFLLFHLMVGCLCFAALGVLVGLICSNGQAANAATSTLFMVIYIPLALQEMSLLFHRVAALTPAFYLQRGSRYFMEALTPNGLKDFAILVGFLLAFALLGYWLGKKPERILMGT